MLSITLFVTKYPVLQFLHLGCILPPPTITSTSPRISVAKPNYLKFLSFLITVSTHALSLASTDARASFSQHSTPTFQCAGCFFSNFRTQYKAICVHHCSKRASSFTYFFGTTIVVLTVSMMGPHFHFEMGIRNTPVAAIKKKSIKITSQKNSCLFYSHVNIRKETFFTSNYNLLFA